MSKKKKIIILSVMVALLVVTGYLNIALNNNVSQSTQTSTTTLDFYASYRADREASRESAILYYDGIIADSTSSQEAKELAEASRQELINAMEKELLIEGLIKSVGFEDVVLTTTSENINVIVKASAEELTDAQLGQIATIIQEQTKMPLDNIRIIPAQ